MTAHIPAGGAPVDTPAPPAATRALRSPAPDITEAAFSDRIVECARIFGWHVHHVGAARTTKGWRTPVRYDGKGFPDLVLVQPERSLIWFRELKAGRRQLEPAQDVWRQRLVDAGANWDLWRPADWPDIVATLSNGRARAT